MRFSTYNILTRQLANRKYVLLNGMRGTLDLVDEEAYTILSSYADAEALSQDVLDLLGEARDYFLERGYLTEHDRDGELAEAEEFAWKLAGEPGKHRRAYLLIPNLGCNYRCTYCFEQGAGYPAVTMSKKQVDAIFKIIREDIEPGDNITLYGGEPLAKENREIIEYIVQKCDGTDNVFFAVTNGHDLDHYIDLLGSRKISLLQITLDGPKEIHDRRRIALDKSSSYDKVLANIETALRDTDVSIRLRINLDKRNAEFILPFLEDLEQHGILDHPAVIISASPVVGADGCEITPREVRKLEKTVEEKYPFFKERFINSATSANDAVLPAFIFGEPVRRKVTVCSASGGSMIFSPDGNIYSCWSFVGCSDHVIGTFDEEGHIVWNHETLDAWRRTMLPYNKKCLACKYAFLCAGGCHWQELKMKPSALTYDCDYYHNLFEDHLARITEEFLAAENG